MSYFPAVDGVSDLHMGEWISRTIGSRQDTSVFTTPAC
jgi:hypothetical protein